MHRITLSVLALCLFSAPALANDYPTTARVQYVVECMAKNGGPDYATMYQCSCSIDRIAGVLSYEDFVEADTYARGRRAGGERGGVLREGERAEQMRALLTEAEEVSRKQCFPGRPH